MKITCNKQSVPRDSIAWAPAPIRQTRQKPYHFFGRYGSQYILPYHFFVIDEQFLRRVLRRFKTRLSEKVLESISESKLAVISLYSASRDQPLVNW